MTGRKSCSFQNWTRSSKFPVFYNIHAVKEEEFIPRIRLSEQSFPLTSQQNTISHKSFFQTTKNGAFHPPNHQIKLPVTYFSSLKCTEMLETVYELQCSSQMVLHVLVLKISRFNVTLNNILQNIIMRLHFILTLSYIVHVSFNQSQPSWADLSKGFPLNDRRWFEGFIGKNCSSKASLKWLLLFSEVQRFSADRKRKRSRKPLKGASTSSKKQRRLMLLSLKPSDQTSDFTGT